MAPSGTHSTPPAMIARLAALLCLATLATAGHAAPEAARPLPFYYDLYTFRGEGGTTRVVASFAVPVGELEEERERWSVRYRFDVSVELADTARRTVTRTDDSVHVRLPRRVRSEHLLHTHVELDARPSRTTVQRVIMTDASTPGIGQLYTTPFTIPDYRGDELMLSDVALGLTGAATGWRRGDATVALLPTRLFPASAFDVFYEVYNLPRGTPYQTDIAIEQIAGPDGEPVVDPRTVHLRFSGEARSDEEGTVAELRSVRSGLDRGRYRITATVTDAATGERARRSRTFRVRGWEPGATLVPALPRRADARASAGGS